MSEETKKTVVYIAVTTFTTQKEAGITDSVFARGEEVPAEIAEKFQAMVVEKPEEIKSVEGESESETKAKAELKTAKAELEAVKAELKAVKGELETANTKILELEAVKPNPQKNNSVKAKN